MAFGASTVGFAFETVTVSTSAVGLTAGTYDPAGESNAAERAVIINKTSNVRYRYDGTDPTSTVGMFLAADSPLILEGNDNIKRIKFIRDSGAGSDATLSVTYER